MTYTESNKSDKQLIASANAGCSRAMEELYHRYRNWVITLAYSVCQHDADAQDILQETFKTFFSKFPGFKLTSQLKTYLYPVVRRKAFDLIRKKQKMVFTDTPHDEIEQQPDQSVDPDTMRNRIAEIVCTLSQEQQDVIILRFVDGYSLAEIGDQLSLPTGTVKSRLHNALKALKKEYNGTAPGTGDTIVRVLLLMF